MARPSRATIGRGRKNASGGRRDHPTTSRPTHRGGRARRRDHRVPYRRAAPRNRAAAHSPLLHEYQPRQGARRPAHGRRARRRCAPRMSEQIRQDLETQLREKLGRADLRVTAVAPIPEGHSGFTYFVTIESSDGSTRYVLRLPPPGARIAGPADVVRQGRIMAALHAAGIPGPAIPAMSSDPVVDGRPFILMEAVDGVRIEHAATEHKAIDITTSVVGVLKHIHAIPLAHTGIGDEESVSLQAEIVRWAMLMQRAPEELTARAGELGGLLARYVPPEREPTLGHGDFP